MHHIFQDGNSQSKLNDVKLTKEIKAFFTRVLPNNVSGCRTSSLERAELLDAAAAACR